jgi:hypothetical protein
VWLNWIYGLGEDMSILEKLQPMGVLMDVTGSNHLDIQTLITSGHLIDSPPSTLFILDVSHLESTDFCALI